MSTPLNPDQPNPAQRDGVDMAKVSHDASAPTSPAGVQQPDGVATATDPARPTSTGKAGFIPGQDVVPALDSAAPTNARLPQRLGDDGKNTPIGFGRLVAVELRKTIDTRAGKWLLGGIFAIMLTISVLMSIFSSDVRNSPEFGGFLVTSALGLKFLLPVIGVMAVTSEWSQRTGLVTFTLEPRRARVALAKWIAALIVGLAVIVFTIIIAAVMTLLVSAIGGHDASWSFGAGRTVWFVVVFLLFVSMGVAFGLLIQNTPAAICAFLFIPIVYSIATGFAPSFGEWTDPNSSLFSLLNDNPEDNVDNQWAKIAVGQLIWLVIPMVLGFIRLNKREVKSS